MKRSTVPAFASLFFSLLLGASVSFFASFEARAYQPPPAPPVAPGGMMYNPWYAGTVVPFFSPYPFTGTPYLPYDRPVPPPIPAPPIGWQDFTQQTGQQAGQAADPYANQNINQGAPRQNGCANACPCSCRCN